MGPSGGFGLQERGSGYNIDALCQLTHLESEVERETLRHVELDVFLKCLLEAGLLDGDGVGAGLQEADGIAARLTGFRFGHNVRGNVRNPDTSIRDRAVG